MRNIFVAGFLAGFASGIYAQTINVRGKISTVSGQAVNNAVVELVRQGLKDTTGTDGMFSLTKTSSAILPSSQINAMSDAMSLAHGVLQLALARPAPVSVEVFDVKGNQLRMESFPMAEAGVYHWDFSQKSLSNQMVLIKASIGQSVRTFRYTPLDEGSPTGNASSAGFTSAASFLAKVASVVDTLKVTASGYATKIIPLGVLDTTANVTLDSAGGGAIASSGCSKTSTLKSGTGLSFTPTGGQARTYNLRLPTDYDNTHPYRLIVSIHWLNGTANDVSNGNNWATTKPYFGLWDLANPTGGKGTTIFVAPQGIGNSWPDGNVPFITALVHQLESELCVDTTRVFAEGFSMGGSMSYALACGAPTMFRGVAVHSGGPMSGCDKSNRKPVAYFMTHGNQDQTCTYPQFGVPQINDFAQLNGCTAMDIASTLVPTDASGMNPKCADFQGCSVGHPARACIFVGPHEPTPGGANSWVPGETWKFLTQF